MDGVCDDIVSIVENEDEATRRRGACVLLPGTCVRLVKLTAVKNKTISVFPKRALRLASKATQDGVGATEGTQLLEYL